MRHVLRMYQPPRVNDAAPDYQHTKWSGQHTQIGDHTQDTRVGSENRRRLRTRSTLPIIQSSGYHFCMLCMQARECQTRCGLVGINRLHSRSMKGVRRYKSIAAATRLHTCVVVYVADVIDKALLGKATTGTDRLLDGELCRP